jgi:hypothetical protein
MGRRGVDSKVPLIARLFHSMLIFIWVRNVRLRGFPKTIEETR